MNTDEKKPRSTDPMLLLAAKLDRLLGEAPSQDRGWALSWLLLKYGQTDKVTLTVEDVTACK